MKRIGLLFFLGFMLSGVSVGQDALSIIDSVNSKVIDNCASFSYDVKVENISDSALTTLDEGHVRVNNSDGKYADFLFVSHHKNDTFCYVTDTLIRKRSEEIFKDYTPQTLHVRLGTSKMFFRCFSLSFINEKNLINPGRWDEIILDSISSEFYHITLRGISTELGILHTIVVNVIIDKETWFIHKLYHQVESPEGDLVKNVFTFDNWSSSISDDDEVYTIFEKLRHRSNDPEYLARYPTRRMRLDHNKTLSLYYLSITDSLDKNYIIGDFDKRYVVMYFWFQGCYHCRHVGPVIQKYHKMNTRGDVTYLGIDTMSKDKNTLQATIKRNQYDFPNYRFNGGVEGLTVNVAPLLIIYDNVENKVLHQLAGGDSDYESRFLKLMEGLIDVE